MSDQALKDVVASRIRSARQALAMTQKELAAAVGMALPSLSDYELGKTMPGFRQLALLMKAGINTNWLLTGEGPMWLADLAQPGEATADRVYVPIPRYVVKGAKGEEREIPSEIASIALSRAWLEAQGVQPHNLVYIRMPDDAMSPTIRPGALLVIDSSTDRLRGDGIYGLMLNEHLTAKRLQLDLGGHNVWVRSDNPAYREQSVPLSALDRSPALLGKIIWCAGPVQE